LFATGGPVFGGPLEYFGWAAGGVLVGATFAGGEPVEKVRPLGDTAAGPDDLGCEPDLPMLTLLPPLEYVRPKPDVDEELDGLLNVLLEDLLPLLYERCAWASADAKQSIATASRPVIANFFMFPPSKPQASTPQSYFKLWRL